MRKLILLISIVMLISITVTSMKLKNVLIDSKNFIACIVSATLIPIQCNAGMLTLPLQSPLHNNIWLVRAGQSYADERDEIQTNPVKKLRMDNGLTPQGQEEARLAAKKLLDDGVTPTFIWTSNTERAYEFAKIMANELVQNNNKEILQKYANSNIKLENEFYYVNEYGFAHQYDETENPSVGTISASCNFSQPPTEITTLEFNKLLAGNKMGSKQSCGVAGYNIENSANGEKSFVDVEGVKHIYTGEIWNSKHESCNLDKKSVTEGEYRNIPVGDPMTATTFCATINVDPLVLEQLSTLSKQLQALGNSVLSEIDLMSATQSTNRNTNFIRTTISSQLEELNRTQQGIIRIGDEYKSTGNIGLTTDSSNTIKARVRDTQLIVNMNYLKYIIGFIIVIFLMGITYYMFSYEISSPLLLLLIIILIVIVLFNFFNFMHNKFYHKFLNKLLLYG